MEVSKRSRVQRLAWAAALVVNVSLVVGIDRLADASLSPAAVAALKAAPATPATQWARAPQAGG